MDTRSLFLRVPRQEIAYLKFIIESYEGMAIIRTKDPDQAIVELMIAPGWEKEVEEILSHLRKEILMEEIHEFQNGEERY